MSQDMVVRFFLFCSRHALLRPISNLIRFLQPLILARTKTAQIVTKITQDPGLPCSNPTNSFWQTPPHPDLSEIQSPKLPTKADVLIIGSGITAASTAHYLLSQDANINVVICEARTITSGATGRNGGHILDLPYDEYELETMVLGKEEAKKLVGFRMAHLSDLLHFAKTELGDEAAQACQVRLVETCDAAFDEEQWVHMKTAFSAWLDDFPEQRKQWRQWEGNEAREKFGMEKIFGAISGPAGAIWPYRFITSVYQNLRTKYPGRLSIETRTPVSNVEASNPPSRYPYTVTTTRGAIQVTNVVHATNGHVGHLLPRLRGKLFPIRGQMTVQKLTGTNAPPNLGGERSWLLRHGRGYDYMTQGPDTGDYYLGGGAMQGGNGGQDALGNAGDDKLDFTALCHLRGVMPMIFEKEAEQRPQIPELKSSWTGTLGFSCDGRPWVGKIPTKISQRPAALDGGVGSGEWISAGFCGNGMVYCWRSGRALASMILGREVDWFPESLRITQERFDSTAASDVGTYWLSLSV